MISQAPFDDVKKSCEVFDKFDSNKNGKLELEELKKCFEEIGMSFEDNGPTIFDLFGVLDIDKNGYLSKVEFYMMIEGLRRHIEKENLGKGN